MTVGGVRPIVVGVDGTPESEFALRWATEEAKLRGLPVRVVNVYEWPPMTPLSVPVSAPLAVGVPPIAEAPEPAKRVLEDAVAYVRDRVGAAQVTSMQVFGRRRAAEILMSESEQAGLLVVGSRSRSALASVVLGSVSSAVAAHAHCPVMVVRSGRTGPTNERIVVGVDGSEESDRALAFGFEEAALRECHLEVVHCWQPAQADELAVWTAARTEKERQARRHWLRSEVAPYEQKYPTVHVTTAVLDGRAAPLLTVRSQTARLVVVGSRGHGGLVGLVLGSVSQALLHHAHCSVIVVRSAAETTDSHTDHE